MSTTMHTLKDEKSAATRLVSSRVRRRTALHLAAALFLALSLLPVGSRPAAALSVADYFSYSYTVQFSKSGVFVGESFTATVDANATCTNSVPLAPSEASFTGRIVATSQASGARVTLNSSYTLNLAPFPARTGESTHVAQVVPLQFPEGSQFGAYNVAGELIEAKVKVGPIWIPVTSYLPSSQAIGTITLMSAAAGGGGAPAPAPLLPPIAPTPPITGAGQASWIPTAAGLTPAAITVTSPDSKSTVTVAPGTLARDSQGNPLTTITCNLPGREAPTPPDKRIVALYDLGPTGATFGTPITIAIKYELASLPAGAVESSLILAFFNEITGGWVALDNIAVDAAGHSVSGTTNHFTQFAVLSSIAPAAAPGPAAAPARPPATAPVPAPTAAPATTPPAAPVPTPAPATPWSPLAGIIAAAVVAGLIASLAVFRWRRSASRH